MADNNDGLVVFPDRSFVTNYGAYNSKNEEFTKYVENVDEKYIQEKIQEVNEKYQVSVNMQYGDYYNIYRVYFTKTKTCIVRIQNPFKKAENGEIEVYPTIYQMNFDASVIEKRYAQ